MIPLFFFIKSDFLMCYKPYMNNYNTALIAMCHLGEKTTGFKEIKEVLKNYHFQFLALFLFSFKIRLLKASKASH